MKKRLLEYIQGGGNLNVLKQLTSEMGVPFLIATGWTFYSLLVAPNKRNVVDAISVFGGSFFLACWAFSQWFRVKKQQAVESGLGGIVRKQEALVAALSEATERLEGHASGGKSIGWLMVTHPEAGAIRNITAHVKGDYPLIDAKASVLDLTKAKLGVKEFERTGDINDFFKYHVMFNCGNLQPSLATTQQTVLLCDTTKPLIRFKVDWTARNGRWTQYIELKRNEGRYLFFTAVQRGDDWVYESPERDSIPKSPDGKPDVFWHTGIAEALAAHDS
jgi:hypothetical protein